MKRSKQCECDWPPYPNSIGCCQFENTNQKLLAHINGEIVMSANEIKSRLFDIGLKRMCFEPITEIEETFIESVG